MNLQTTFGTQFQFTISFAQTTNFLKWTINLTKEGGGLGFFVLGPALSTKTPLQQILIVFDKFNRSGPIQRGIEKYHVKGPTAPAVAYFEDIM